MRRLCLLAALLAASFTASAGDAVTILRVIDGDTLRVRDGEEEITVRLLGIDTPEVRANRKAKKDAEEWGVTVEEIIACGEKASAFVSAIAPPGLQVRLTIDGEDAYGRTLAYVALPDGRGLNEILVRNGAALAPSHYRHVRWVEFAEIQREAREKRRGFWKTLWKHL